MKSEGEIKRTKIISDVLHMISSLIAVIYQNTNILSSFFMKLQNWLKKYSNEIHVLPLDMYNVHIYLYAFLSLYNIHV